MLFCMQVKLMLCHICIFSDANFAPFEAPAFIMQASKLPPSLNFDGGFKIYGPIWMNRAGLKKNNNKRDCSIHAPFSCLLPHGCPRFRSGNREATVCVVWRFDVLLQGTPRSCISKRDSCGSQWNPDSPVLWRTETLKRSVRENNKDLVPFKFKVQSHPSCESKFRKCSSWTHTHSVLLQPLIKNCNTHLTER